MYRHLNHNRRRKNDSGNPRAKIEKSGLSVTVRNGDLNQALRVLKKKIKKADLMQEIKDRKFYTKPSDKKRLAKKRAIKRWKKYEAKRDMEQ